MIFRGKKILKWKKMHGQILLHTKFARVDKDQVRLPSGELINYYITSRNIRAVAVIARDEKTKFVFSGNSDIQQDGLCMNFQVASLNATNHFFRRQSGS
jgi:predicted 2-oxoglutarate/Fe(II)-dependent dioxygenase YbiX